MRAAAFESTDGLAVTIAMPAKTSTMSATRFGRIASFISVQPTSAAAIGFTVMDSETNVGVVFASA